MKYSSLFKKISVAVLMVIVLSTILIGCGGKDIELKFYNGDTLHDTVILVEGKVVFAAEPTKVGYIFDDWFYDKDVWKNELKEGITINETDSVYAKWSPIDYTIEFVANFDTDKTMTSQSMATDEVEALNSNIFSRDEYIFQEWNTVANGTGVGYADKASFTMEAEGNTTLYAIWMKNGNAKYSVEVFKEQANGLYEGVLTNMSGTIGSLAETTAKIIEGYTYQADKSTLFGKINSNGTLALKVYYNLNKYNITFVDESGYNDEQIIEVKHNLSVMPPLFTRPGYKCSWDTSLMGFQSDAEVKAIWIANDDTVYKVEYYFENVAGTEFILDASHTVTVSGTTDQIAETLGSAKAGFTFDNTIAESKLNGIITSDGALVLREYYTRNSYNVTFVKNDEVAQGTMEKQSFKFEEVKNLTINEYIKVGYTFEGWTTETNVGNQMEEYVDNGEFIMHLEEVTLYALWSANTDTPYTVNIYKENIADEHYSLTTLHEVGITDCTVELEKYKIGFTFEADKSTTKGEIAGDGSLVLTIYYSRNLLYLRYDDNIAEGSGNMDAQAFRFEETLMLKANAYTRMTYEFIGWTTVQGSKDVEYLDCAEFTMDGSQEYLYAVWAKGTTAYTIETYIETMIHNDYTKTSETMYGVSDETITLETRKNGFDSKSKVTGVVTEDGLLVLKVYYDRQTYNVTLLKNADDAKGTMKIEPYKFEEERNLTVNAYTRVGYKFLGWATTKSAADIGTVHYADAGLYIKSDASYDIKLYAVWQAE